MAGQRIHVDGYSFQNEQELRVYWGLLKMVKDGRVSDLDIHPKYPLTVNQKVIGQYQPTFHFMDHLRHEERFVQIVGGSNPFRDFKKALFEALYEVKVEDWS
ncbi:MAG: DUF1064 domain-containing protein [Streptococcus sp.]|nr:DUF1064 domain-containing protein [Streptococcus sp.]